MVVLASVRLGKVLRKSDLLNLLEGLQKLFGAIVQFLGGIPKRPKGPDCKSGGVSLHRFESCFPQFRCMEGNFQWLSQDPSGS